METTDRDAVREFLAREAPGSPIPETALLGKLAGELVAILAMEITAGSAAIRDLVVAHDLRRKRIGRFMIDELDSLASKMDLGLTLACEAPAGFVASVGFALDGGRIVRRVAR